MSLADLDALLKTPLGQKVKRKKKRGRRGQRAKSSAIMSQIEAAQERIDKWQLSTSPLETLIVVQRTSCSGCGSQADATISPPMTGYRDRLRRTRYQPSTIPLRNLPVRIQRSEVTVPICHYCYGSAQDERQTFIINEIGEAVPMARQLSLPFNKEEPPQQPSTALVPISQTPQALMWIVWALSPMSRDYEEGYI